ncbi:MAG: hypothetical protein EOP88_14080 [Verrucomicrobiaceae bacterium]|nr:MAG: hypothetical protein EOP88_14080 [Verrucomicrobiaceae bacterium]
MRTTILAFLLGTATLLPAAELEVPTGKFAMAISTRAQGGEASIATLLTTGKLAGLIRFSTKYSNRWEIPLVFRQISPHDEPAPCLAFEGNYEGDYSGGGIHSFRISGRVMPDGSIKGVWLRHASYNEQPGYAISGTFELKPLAAEE